MFYMQRCVRRFSPASGLGSLNVLPSFSDVQKGYGTPFESVHVSDLLQDLLCLVEPLPASALGQKRAGEKTFAAASTWTSQREGLQMPARHVHLQFRPPGQAPV